MDHSTEADLQWPLWRKIIFRFFFIYITLVISPWTWLDAIPGVNYVTQYYYQLMDWAVRKANAKFFHIREVLIEPNGSGDTSWAWAQTWLLLILALMGCIIWSILDRKRPDYFRLNYWLCLFTRYYVAMVSFTYGIIKLFALQMFFPNLSQLATPLGDFLPMRLSWMFIGYSTPYQVFSGIMETLVGLLLLYRRTATLGILMGTAVFLNVMMLNLSYDIPVKLYSMHIVFLCVFLLVNEWNRVICFFLLNRQAPACTIYYYPFTQKWMKVTRIVLKIMFIIIAVGLQFYNTLDYYKQAFPPEVKQDIWLGVYAVEKFTVNKDTIPVSPTDTIRWQDVIFDKGNLGSIKTSDTAYRQRYKRAYFYYTLDSTKHMLDFRKFQGDSLAIASFYYEQPDSSTVYLRGKQRNDSLYITLKRLNRHFQLAEKQFHWLSEANR
ncbi:MAG: hypothetical protein JST09_21225 [Bacteroidetes bacterium]|nr:hypothetical protein [Bacteroidota bacterium]